MYRYNSSHAAASDNDTYIVNDDVIMHMGANLQAAFSRVNRVNARAHVSSSK